MFGDHRHFRFHSGIDIPTRGKIGYRVFACRSGSVYRIYASWNGYGKAVYLKLDDGRFAVYAHLSGFSDRIGQLVTERQLEQESYYTDLFLEEEQIRVEKGELIGYSGETGWGWPHLHFELRDSTNNPLNPLIAGISVDDGIPPVMEFLAIRPLAWDARVNGSTRPVVSPLSWDGGQGTYRLKEKLLLDGEVGLELSVYDRARNSGYKFGVFGLELYLDDSLLFASQYDRISFQTTHQVELDRDFGLRKSRGKDFHKLYVDLGNDLLLYDPRGGRINTRAFPPGIRQATIRAFDAQGNPATLLVDLIFDQSPSITSCLLERSGDEQSIRVRFDDYDDPVQEIILEKRGPDDLSWQVLAKEEVGQGQGEHVILVEAGIDRPGLLRVRLRDGFGAFSEWKYLAVHMDQPAVSDNEDSLDLSLQYDFKDNLFIFDLGLNRIFREEPALTLKSGEFDFDPLFLEQTDVGRYQVVFPFFLEDQREMTFLLNGVSPSGDTVNLKHPLPVAIITDSHGGVAISLDGEATLEMGPDVVYRDMNVTIDAIKPESKTKHKLVGKVYQFEPSDVPLKGRARVSIGYPADGCDPLRLALYELAGESSWKHIGHELDTANRRVEGQVRYLSSYALLEDTLPPRIDKISIRPGSSTRDRKPRITAVVKDDLSGIGNDQDIRVEIDGKWMIPEYDVEKKILFSRPVSPLAYGRHLLTISAKDRMGNRSRIARQFFVKRR